ncbi:SLC13 family permease [Paenibacillus qinlingensis]|uniref:Na+/H+ antiporter NhaD/arsenite permease-like protein n=1 Tax=Paenibacillus qinlingensis TaxID=1837343 RepID=A0ABU1P7K1_9BACL|nr:SLC13 family permease [Paenibacillus qinlingensis]MDR6555554.1 Na+/H+ antiporter NhaD/arsenite permease-like protein [Paenibacillus qinlingensis]
MTEFSQGPAMWQALAVLLIFAAAYVCILIEKWDRMYTALGGACLMLILGIVPLDQALSNYANWSIIIYLVSLFILSTLFQKTGIPSYIVSSIVRKYRMRALTLIICLSLLAALISALLDSLMAVVVIVPFIIIASRKMRLVPAPFLIAMLLSVHIGGAATIMGNLPSRMLGASGHVSAGQMFLKIFPLICLLLAVVYFIMWLIYRKRLIAAEAHMRELLSLKPSSYVSTNRIFVWGSSLITGVTLLVLCLHGVLAWSPAYIAACGAIAALAFNYKDIVETIKNKNFVAVWHQVIETQWLFFLGLFIMVGGLTYAGFSGFIASRGLELSQGSIPFLTVLLLWLNSFGAAMMDNIPFIAAMIPIVDHMEKLVDVSTQPIWWALIVGSGIGSGVTLISSIASLYAASFTYHDGVKLKQSEYVVVAAPICFVLLLISTVYFKLFLL